MVEAAVALVFDYGQGRPGAMRARYTRTAPCLIRTYLQTPSTGLRAGEL